MALSRDAVDAFREVLNETGVTLDDLKSFGPDDILNFANPLFYYLNLTEVRACPGTEAFEDCFYRTPYMSTIN